MNKSKIIQKNWYSIDLSKINKIIEGKPKYVNTFTVCGNYQPSAVFYVSKPDKSKGHKNFVLITKDYNSGQYYISGMDRKEIQKYSEWQAVECLKCGDIIFSCMRHDYCSCSCGENWIDGGSSYVRGNITKHGRHCTIDLVKNKVLR